MKWMIFFLKISFLLVISSLASQANAMPIKDFFQMSDHNQAMYSYTLHSGVESYLKKEQKNVELEKFNSLFDYSKKEGSKIMSEYVGALFDLKRMDEEGRSPMVPHVEHAMYLALRRNDINIPLPALMQFAKDFKPSDKQFADEEK